MATLEEEWAKYVAPFIKEPGCITRDPVVAAAHLTTCFWMEAMDHGHHSFSDPERHVRMFRKAILEECAKIAESFKALDPYIASTLAMEIRKKE